MPSARRPPVRRRASAGRAPAPPRQRRPVRTEADPHAHIVCRGCGRIQELALSELDRLQLSELALRAPDDWSIERIAFSLAGTCQRCREGRGRP